MPTVFTISGAEQSHSLRGLLDNLGVREEDCKAIKMKSGCEILSCPTKTAKGRRWRFVKGSMRCPAKGR